MSNSNAVAFPDHNEDPKKKGKEWILKFAQAVWGSWSFHMPSGSIFLAKAARYQEIKDYATGKQSVNKYKKQLLPEEEQDESWSKIDWTPPANGMVIRNIAVSKLQKAGYNILCTPINPQAKDAQDEEYAKAKIKIMMRDALKAQGMEDQSLKKMPGEAQDLEELQMEIDHNPKFIRSKDVEESVQLVFYENEADKVWDTVAEDIVDLGVGVVKEDLNEENKVIFRKVEPDVFGCSYTTKSDFSDITWAFELVPYKISDLAKKFTEEEMKTVQAVAGKNGNPQQYGGAQIINNGFDPFKAVVMDLYFITYNKSVTEENKDKSGNLRISKTKPSNDGKVSKDSVFTAKTIEVLYQCKWVMGTELIFDFGIAPNQKRTVKIATMSKTKLPYHIQATNFHKMKATGLTEMMIPIIDDMSMATYKLRNFRNEMVPNGWDIDLAAIEGVALGKAGQAMKPMEVLDLFFQKGILISRRSGIGMDSNVNYKAINPISNNSTEQLTTLFNDIQASKQNLRDVTGLNELTDGSTPNARMLTTTANLANESTNNALWPFIKARKNLLESTAKGIVQRLQVAIKRGPYDGYNKSTGKWITVPKSIADYDYDLMIEDKTSDEQKQWLLELVKEDIANGYLDTADVITIIYNNNLKQAYIILSYRVQKNKEKAQQMALQNTQATSQAQMQSNQQAEQLKDMMADRQAQRQIAIDNNMMAWQYEIAKVKAAQADLAVDKKAVAQIVQTHMQGQQAEAENAQENAAEGGVEEAA